MFFAEQLRLLLDSDAASFLLESLLFKKKKLYSPYEDTEAAGNHQNLS